MPLRLRQEKLRTEIQIIIDNYLKDHPSKIPTGKNKKVIGMFKDEAGGKIIQGFVGLRAKLYAYKMLDGKEVKKCKGIRKPVIKKDISFEDYERCLFSGCEQMRKMNIIQSRKHTLYTEEVNKVAMSANKIKHCQKYKKNYLLKHIKLLIIKQYNYTELTLLEFSRGPRVPFL